MTRDVRGGLELVVVSDGRADSERILRVAEAAARGGASAICVREASMTARDLAALVHALVARLRPLGALVLVNDRLDVALACGADGAQLGFRALELAEARRIAPPPFLLGVSAHAGDDLERLARGGADFALLGPIFDTPSKRGWKAPMGVDELHRAAARAPLPVVAIGGIEASNAGDVRATSAAGIAVIRAVFEAEDPQGAARALAPRSPYETMELRPPT